MRAFLLLPLLLVARLSHAALSVGNQHLGEIYQFNHVKASVSVSNTSDAPVKILKIEPVRSGDRAIQVPSTIPAKSTVNVEVEIFSGEDLGESSHRFLVRTDPTEGNSVPTLAVSFFGMTLVDGPALRADFGVVKSEDPAAEKTLTLDSRDAPDLQATSVLSSPGFVDVKIGPERRSVSLRVGKDAQFGIQSGTVKLATNSKLQPEIWIPVRIDVHGDVVPSVNPLDLGALRVGEEGTYLVKLESRSDKPVKVVDAKLEGIAGKVEAAACTPKKSSCALLKIHLAKIQSEGIVTGVLSAKVSGSDKRMSVIVGGMAVSKTAKIVPIDEAAKQSSAPAPADAQAPPPIDLGGAVRSAVRRDEQAALTPPEGRGPLLKWAVANEQIVYGYVVYRADAEKGPYVRVNKETIRVASDDHGEGAYQWRDTSAEPGKTYWYSVAVIHTDGHREQLTTAQKVLAK